MGTGRTAGTTKRRLICRWAPGVAALATVVTPAMMPGATATTPAGDAFQAPQIGVDGQTVLGMATHRVTPDFPVASLRAGVDGVVVAQVLVGSDGTMQSADVLEAPDAATGAAVRQALLQWKFRTLNTADGRAAAVRSRFALYFLVRKGKALVLDWVQMAALRQSEEPPTASGPIPTTYPTIDEAAWRRLNAGARPTLLDIRDRAAFARGHLDGAVNISERELSMRAPAELSRTRPLVVDCPRETGDLCSYAARILQRAGFREVFMLNRK
jgi:rhodanese-related sulfurtransferase